MDGNHHQPMTGVGVGSIALALATVAGETAQAEQWIHLLPAGGFQGRDGRGPWLVDNPQAVVAASLAYAGAKPLPVDYEHQTDMAPKNGQPAPAAGWIKQLQARPDGLWGLVEWTERARAYLSAKEYRYLSPVFNHAPSGEVTRVLRAALTNNPALELTALATTQGAVMQTPDPLAELRSLLGLAADADIPAILQKVRGLKTAECSANPDPAKFVPIEVFQEVLATAQGAKQQADEATVIATVDGAIQQGHILQMQRDAALALCRSDRKLYEEFVGSMSPFLAAVRGTQTGGLSPEARAARAAGGSVTLTGGAGKAAPYLDQSAQAICKALGHSAEEFTQLGVSHAG